VPQVLSETGHEKIDSRSDESFYRSPRFVTHADDPFCSRLTELYASVTSPGDRIFDAMSSWVSFLPPYTFEHVVGHGLNRAEIEANERLNEFFVQNFNADQTLPLGDEQCDRLVGDLTVGFVDDLGVEFVPLASILIVAVEGDVVGIELRPTDAELAEREPERPAHLGRGYRRRSRHD